MLNKSITCFNKYKRIHSFYNLFIKNKRYIGNNSYFHQPGLEPLRYVTVGDTLEETVEKWPDRLAVRSVHQNTSLTYSELLTKADALSYALLSTGLRRGDRLGVWAHNCAEWIIILAAAVRIGVIPVAINPAYEMPELSFCIKKVGMKALLIGQSIQGRQYGTTLNKLIPELHKSVPGKLNFDEFSALKIIISCGNELLPGSYNFNSLIKDFEKQSRNGVSKYSSEINPDDGCIIHFTSGTTGNPKAALDSHFGIVNNTYGIGKRNLLYELPHSICVQVPIFHAFGTVITVFTALRYGATLILPSPFYNARANADAIHTERCTAVYGTPTMFVDLISETQKQGAPSSNVKLVLTAGAPCSPQLFRDIQTYIQPDSVKSLFGMTETTAAIFQSLPGETMEQVTETVGCLHEHIEVKVVDDNDKMVPYGSPGELLVRGYNTMMCYWDEPEKTKQTIGEDCWLRTGDKFVIQPDGYGRIVGRLKDIVVRGGENISPKEIEDILDTHPDIIESQIIGVPDDRLGEELCAVIRVQNKTFSIEDLKTHCYGKLAKFKIPRLLKIIEEYPKTASGKIQKYKLREMIEAGKI